MAKNQPQPEELDSLCMLKFGYHFRMVLTVDAAVRILNILGKENIQKANAIYREDKSVETLMPWGTEEITIGLISPAEVLLRQAAYQADEERKAKS